MSGFSKFMLAGMVAAGTLVAAPQVASAQQGWDNGRIQSGLDCYSQGCSDRYNVRDFRGRDRGDRGWRNRRGWDDDYRPYRRHHRNYWPRSGFSVDLYVPSYRYEYVEPRYVQPRRTIRLSAAHVEWCYDRWRSYRDWDNTYQPNHGSRRQCYSPYS